MNGETKDENVKEMARAVCKDFLGGVWQEISLEEFQLHEVSGGLSNTLYRCALPNSATKDTEVPKEVLLRIYGPIQDDPNVVIAEAVTFMLLSERQLGPKLYGLFPKGRLEEFIPSHSLSSNEIRQNSILIAREMAKIHALDVPVKKMPNLFQFFSKWLCEVQEVLDDDSDNYFMPFNEYAEEIKWIEQEMAKTKCPVVYCHNDLQGGNILCREDATPAGKSNIMLIDFEFGCYNYRSFDLANHFIEWCFDYSTPTYPHFEMDLDKFPSKEDQTEFLTAYLNQLSKENGKLELEIPLDDEIGSIIDEISLFASACCFLWSIWSAKMTLTSSFEFAHREHGKTRKKLYKKFKEDYLMSRR